MKTFFLTFTLVFILLLLQFCANLEDYEGQNLTADPIGMVSRLYAALNRGNVGASQALFADDVAYTDEAGNITIGKAAIAQWLRSQVERKTSSEVTDIWQSGDIIMWTSIVHMKGWQYQSQSAAVVERGRIVAFTTRGLTSLSVPKLVKMRESSQTGILWSSCREATEAELFYCIFAPDEINKDREDMEEW